MKKSKPDNVVFNEETNSYNASLKSYGTNVGAPAIELENTALWKHTQVQKVNHQFHARYKEIKSSYQAMMEQFEYNAMIYNANFNFEPVIGGIYHLYKDKGETPFLSIIPPHECNFDYVNSFCLNSNMVWELVENDSNQL